MLSEYSQDLKQFLRKMRWFFRNRDDFNKIDLLLENHLKRKIEKLRKVLQKGHSISDRARFVIKF